jgi:hypothetical protein
MTIAFVLSCFILSAQKEHKKETGSFRNREEDFSSAIEIPIDSVSFYEKKLVKVCGRVDGIKVTDSDKPVTYLNIDGKYPKQKLIIVIFKSNIMNFSLDPAEVYMDKNICVSGRIKKYKEKYEIIASSEKQIIIK